MTGGSGFIRDSIISLKRNRALLEKRKKMADNPYSDWQNEAVQNVDNYDELQKWKLFDENR